MDTGKETCYRTLRGGIALLAFATAFAGCAQHRDAIAFATNTVVGVKIGTDARQAPEIQVGYARQEGTYLPLYVNDGTSKEIIAGQFKKDTGKNWTKADKLLSLAATELQLAQGSLNQSSGADTTAALQHLSKASKHTLAAKSGFDADFINTLKDYINLATGKVNDAVAAGNAADKKDLVQQASQQIELALSLAYIELDLPIAMLAFNPQAKYIGYKTADRQEDAYSVLGTFSGNLASTNSAKIDARNADGGESPKPGADSRATIKGGISQFFATGIAAQIMAEKGGAALVNSSDIALPPGVEMTLTAKPDNTEAGKLKAAILKYYNDPSHATEQTHIKTEMIAISSARYPDWNHFVNEKPTKATADELKTAITNLKTNHSIDIPTQ